MSPYTFTIQGSGTTAAIPTAQLDTESLLVPESIGEILVTIQLNAPSNGTVQVYYDQEAGTASPDDYSRTYGYADFSTPGQTTFNILVPIVNDSQAEGNETFTIVLSSPVNCNLGTPASATVTIVDDDSTLGMNLMFLPILKR